MVHQTFQEALNKTEFSSARDKQELVFDAFRAGRHVILKAPTGWGKTFAVNAALGEGHHIYSLPLRVLVDSLAEATNKFGLYKCVAHHGQARNHPFLDPGDDPKDPYRLVYTTLDQTLSAFLGIPIGVSLRQGNILPAVIDNSHLIFDEFHLFEPEKSWTTALFALQRAKKNCIILTATLSDYMLGFLEDFLGNKTAVGREFDVEVIEADRPFINRKQIKKGVGFKNIEQLELGDRTIIIKNDIESAKTTAKKLRESSKVDQPVYLLHSELLSEDRKRTEHLVQTIFGEKGTDKAILVATQVVEAGIDITCDVMHTDLCPPSSFIQRAGRNARYEEDKDGKIVWHPVENGGPYRSQEKLIKELGEYLKGKNLLDEETEQEIINISESLDKKQIEQFQQRDLGEVDWIRAVRDYTAYPDMIRCIDNKNVAVGTDLNQSYHFISVTRSKFYNKESLFCKAIQKPSKYGVYNSELKEVVPTAHLESADFILLDPEFVGYIENLGFTFKKLEGREKFIDSSGNTFTKYDYENETYEEHINRLFEKLLTVSWIVDHLVSHPLIGTEKNAVFISRFLIWAHDLGKLNIAWQKVHQVGPNGIPMAHTKKGGRFGRKKRAPKHAWISAWVVHEYLIKLFGKGKKGLQLFKAMFWAIADHHGYSDNLNIKDLTAYEICYKDYLSQMTQNNSWIDAEWNQAIAANSKVFQSDLQNILIHLNSWKITKDDDLSLYFMLSYILRKCDQKATELVSTVTEEEKKSKKQVGGFVG